MRPHKPQPSGAMWPASSRSTSQYDLPHRAAEIYHLACSRNAGNWRRYSVCKPVREPRLFHIFKSDAYTASSHSQIPSLRNPHPLFQENDRRTERRHHKPHSRRNPIPRSPRLRFGHRHQPKRQRTKSRPSAGSAAPGNRQAGVVHERWAHGADRGLGKGGKPGFAAVFVGLGGETRVSVQVCLCLLTNLDGK